MIKRYKMPCFETQRHGLQEDPEGYIVNAVDYDALVAEMKVLRRENDSLKDQLKEAIATAAAAELSGGKKKKVSVKWAIKVQIDENEWELLRDLSDGSVLTYGSRADAEKAGAPHGSFKVEKVA